MKYTILGFSQQAAIECNLSIDELLILRWMVDFTPSPQMVKSITEDGIYYWVNYSKILEDIPILKCNKRNLAIKMKKLVDAKILDHKTVKMGGTFSYYKFGEKYITLVSKTDHPMQKTDTPRLKTDEPTSENRRTVRPKTDEQKINLLKDSSIKDSIVEVDTSTRFTPPTLEEVSSYCSEKGYIVNPETFFNHYESNGWKVGKNKMKKWRAALASWNSKEVKPSTSNKSKKSTGNVFLDMLREEEA